MNIDGLFARKKSEPLVLNKGETVIMMMNPQKDRYRPCYVYNAAEDREVKAIFHEWQFNSKDELCGIIEFESGYCGLYSVGRIRFIDTDVLIGGWIWPQDTKDGQ